MEVIRLVGVIRQSKTHEDAISEESQRSAITFAVEAKNNQNTGVRYEIVGWAVDLGVSADKTTPWDRPQLGEWLNNKTTEFDGLISWKLDRVCRSILDFARFIQWLDDHKKTYMATADPIDLSTPIGRAVAQILAILAELELSNIKTRNKQTRKALNEAGRWTGGRIPYGRMAVKGEEGWKLVKDPNTSKHFYRMFEMALAGESFSSIALTFNTEGVPTPQDAHSENYGRDVERPHLWSSFTVAQILRARHLIGEREINGKVLRNADGSPVIYCEPLISHSDWKLLQGAIAEKGQEKGKYRKDSSLLRKVGKCGVCGMPLHITQTGGQNNSRRIPRYRCASYTYKAQGRQAEHCKNPSISAPELDEIIEITILNHAGHLPRLEKTFVPGEDHSEELDQLDDAITGIRRERDLGLYEGDEDGYIARLTSLVSRRKELLKLPQRPAGYEYRPTGQTVAEYWASLDRQGRNAFLQETGVQLFYDKSSGAFNCDIKLGDLDQLHRVAQGMGS
ncbi:recombinase family protein [Planomonospora algeriensis]